MRRFLMACALFVLLAAGSIQAVHGQQSAPAQDVTVGSGDTLWSIAVAHYPDADPRQKVGEIMRLNGLHDPGLVAGERLRLPAG